MREIPEAVIRKYASDMVSVVNSRFQNHPDFTKPQFASNQPRSQPRSLTSTEAKLREKEDNFSVMFAKNQNKPKYDMVYQPELESET